MTDPTPRPLTRSIKGTMQATGYQSRSYIYDLLKAEKLKAIKDGRRTLILEDSIQKYLASLPPFKSKAAA
jgi:excisionase family DNA binding protein